MCPTPLPMLTPPLVPRGSPLAYARWPSARAHNDPRSQGSNALALLRESHIVAAIPRASKAGNDETRAFIAYPFIGQDIDSLGEDLVQHLAGISPFKLEMDGLSLG
ncbi:MAG TPA: hypothetical protein PKD12_24415 [Nitrospira sp.]|nr:hypothetical protein [Nitrospira sp.]